MEARNLPPALTVEAAAELLGISRRHAYASVERGDLPSFKIGHAIRVPTIEVLKLLHLEERHSS